MHTFAKYRRANAQPFEAEMHRINAVSDDNARAMQLHRQYGIERDCLLCKPTTPSCRGACQQGRMDCEDIQLCQMPAEPPRLYDPQRPFRKRGLWQRIKDWLIAPGISN